MNDISYPPINQTIERLPLSSAKKTFDINLCKTQTPNGIKSSTCLLPSPPSPILYFPRQNSHASPPNTPLTPPLLPQPLSSTQSIHNQQKSNLPKTPKTRPSSSPSITPSTPRPSPSPKRPPNSQPIRLFESASTMPIPHRPPLPPAPTKSSTRPSSRKSYEPNQLTLLLPQRRPRRYGESSEPRPCATAPDKRSTAPSRAYRNENALPVWPCSMGLLATSA